MKTKHLITKTSAIVIILATFVSCSDLLIQLDNSGISYVVKHFQQNINDDKYTEVTADSQILKGRVGADTAAVAKNYKGFTAKTIKQSKIASDGSTVVNIYYDRNLYTVSFDTNGGSNVESVIVRYGETIVKPQDPQKERYSFVNWYKNRDFSDVYDFVTPVTDSTVLYVKWREEAGATARAAIVINGITYDKTEEIYVIPPYKCALIEEEKDLDYVANALHEYDKGVFRAGRKVKLSPYIMSKYEVTQELYKTVMMNRTEEGQIHSDNPSCCQETGDYPLVNGEIQKYRPVDMVTWYDAVYFCNVLTELAGGGLTKAYDISMLTVNSQGHITTATVTIIPDATGYRLPTEAEWEFAARGGDPAAQEWKYYFSGHPADDRLSYNTSRTTEIDSVGWYMYNTSNGGLTGNSTPKKGTQGYGAHQVGLKAPNSLDLYDMSGNAFEWCYDWINNNESINDSAYTIDGVVVNPKGPTSSTIDNMHILRGGCWNNTAYLCSVLFRRYMKETNSDYYPGIRLVRSCPEE